MVRDFLCIIWENAGWAVIAGIIVLVVAFFGKSIVNILKTKFSNQKRCKGKNHICEHLPPSIKKVPLLSAKSSTGNLYGYPTQ